MNQYFLENRKKTFLYTKKNGITLTTLVIAIVVLLILAGVSLSIFGDNKGLLDRTESAYNSHDIEAAKETIDLITTDLVSNYYNSESIIKSNPDIRDYIKSNIQNNGKLTDYEVETSNDDYKITITNKNKTDLSATGEIKEDGSIIWE